MPNRGGWRISRDHGTDKPAPPRGILPDADPSSAPPFTTASLGQTFAGFLRLAGPYWTDGAERWHAWSLAAALAAFGAAQVLLAVWLNSWMADLFDALGERSAAALMAQVPAFATIVIGTMLTNAAHLEAKRRLQLGWRRWLTTRVLGQWLDDGRQYQVALLPGDHANPDGRIAEDARIATEYALDLATTFYFCVLLLVSFVGILWALSGNVVLAGIAVPGHMVWLAVLYAALGSAVAFLLGRSLVRATNQRQGAEADYRFGLVAAREDAERVALATAEAEERGRLSTIFLGIIAAWGRQTAGLRQILLFSSGYTVLAPVLPILVSAPRYLAEAITLGGLMQTAQAFQQVTAALSWPVDNFARIAEWRASVERVLALQTVILRAPAPGAPGTIRRSTGPTLLLDEVSIGEPDSGASWGALDLEIRPGERVCITGDPAATGAVFATLAGIRRWGSGRILLPRDAAIGFAAQRPYLPEASLRRVLTFPAETRTASHADDAEMIEALQRAGLPWLVGLLDEAPSWKRVLGPQDQQRLTVARLFLARPRWIVLHDACDALDPGAKAELLSLLVEASGAAVLAIGRDAGPPGFFTRRLRLSRSGSVALLRPEVEVFASHRA